jgi:hypothetical protein
VSSAGGLRRGRSTACRGPSHEVAITAQSGSSTTSTRLSPSLANDQQSRRVAVALFLRHIASRSPGDDNDPSNDTSHPNISLRCSSWNIRADSANPRKLQNTIPGTPIKVL